jgi:hypothetical protein
LANSGARQVERITSNLRCPGCEYDLRGLGGEIVTCPECGTATDVARLVVGRWQGPWYQAPGYSGLVWPVAWLMSCGLVFMCAGAMMVERIEWAGDWLPLAIMMGVTVLGWLLILSLLRGRMAGRAVPLSLLAHGLTLGYIVGVAGVIWGGVNLFRMSGIMAAQALSAVVAILGGTLFWACRRCERWIGGVCIRHHLMDQARVEAPEPSDVESDA